MYPDVSCVYPSEYYILYVSCVFCAYPVRASVFGPGYMKYIVSSCILMHPAVSSENIGIHARIQSNCQPRYNQDTGQDTVRIQSRILSRFHLESLGEEINWTYHHTLYHHTLGAWISFSELGRKNVPK